MNNWTKVTEESMEPQHPLRNWVRGDHAWYNIDKFSKMYVQENANAVYNGTKPWAIFAAIGNQEAKIIKTYVKSESAYKWLTGVMNNA